MKIKIKKLHDDIVIPKKMTEGSAAFDLHIPMAIIIPPRTPMVINMGFEVEIESGYCMKILPRSGLALKKSITVLNSPGLIDEDYRNPIGVILYNHSDKEVFFNKGDRIAQARIEKNIEVEFEEVEELSETDRKGGFGSTGK